MFDLKLLRNIWRVCFLLALWCPLDLWAAPEDTVLCWQPYQIDLQATKSISNPYVETISSDSGTRYLSAVFHCVSGEGQGKRMVVHGFWDGGDHWVIRFAPPAPGQWRYETISPDKGMDAQTGTLWARTATAAERRANPLCRGFLYVADNGRNFCFADQTPFLWIGDTWWAWADPRIRFQSFKTLADDRADKGFTLGQMAIRMEKVIDASGRPDFSYLHHAEAFIRYANSRGIVVAVSGLWGGKITPEIARQSRRWWKYLISRLQAYQVIWMVASEYNLNDYGGAGLDYWKALGQLVKDQDPYRRITSLHNTPPNWKGGTQGDSRQWSTGEVLHQAPWLDYNQSQLGHGKYRNEMAPRVVRAAYARMPPKPIVITEPWYEFVPGSASAMDVRFACWSSFLCGGAGITYGGGHIWWAYLPDNHSKPLADMGGFPQDPDLQANTLNYPGARSVSFMAHFLSDKPWWRWQPHEELIQDYPAPFCKADPGNQYLVYLRYGGNFRLDLRATGDRPLRCEWVDLVSGRTRTEQIQGGTVRQFWNARDYPGSRPYHDFLVYIQVAKAPAGNQ